MKKAGIIFLVFISARISSQTFFKGVGIFGSVTSSKHEYRNADTDKKDTTYVPEHFYPQTHISKEFINWGAGIFLELGLQRLRWQTELEYANKGAQEMGFGPAGYQYTG